ncbi:MAG: hypothetical protein CEE42_03660 [Promethearchaeota archaeon Loki_b31]|nr:MAG: hypothetical protein CEE42_03660 [Candidatus Lokiarchaeota archaeon Loki_b31]
MDFGSEVEDDKGYLDEQKGEDEEKKEDDINDDSELEEEKDFEDDQIKSGEFEGDLDQELPEEKEESIWDDIDWSEDKHGEREKTIWDDIDWSEDKHGEREKTIWDDIDWSEDKQGEREKTIWDEINWSEDLHGEGEKNEKDNNDIRNEEHQEEEPVEYYNENIDSQSTSTVLTSEIEDHMEHQEQEEEIEIRPEEYQDDTEPIVNTDEIEFIKDVEELAEHARELKAEDENVEPQAEQENAAYYAEQYYEKLKEKEVVNDQNSIEEQETEELRQEVTEELKGDQESGNKSDELEEEDASKKITSTEEFEYLWEIRDKLDREGKPLEEIEEVMHEAEEMYETLKNAEKLYEELQQEKLKLVDHEDEASEEDLKENLDRVDLVEQAVELEEKLVQQGESQEEIDARVEEAIETTKFEEKLEKIIEKDQESIVNEKLKKHDLEINEQDSNKNVENKENLEVCKPELDAIESESEANKDFLEESTKLVSEESDEEETEHLQELYRLETGRRPIYSKKKTNGYSQWLEQRELGSEKIKNSKSESEKIKEIEEESWKTTLKQWIKESSEEECNAELKSELKKALESYNKFKDLTRKFLELYEKSQYEKLTEIEKNRLKSLTERLQGLGPIHLELLANIRTFKDYFYNHLWELMNRFFVIRVRSKFFKHISQKYKELRKEQENGKIQIKWSSEISNLIEAVENEKTPTKNQVKKKKLIANTDKFKELKKIVIEQLKYYHKMGKKKYSNKEILEKIEYFNQERVRKTIIQLIGSQNLYVKFFMANNWVSCREKIFNNIYTILKNNKIVIFNFRLNHPKEEFFDIIINNVYQNLNNKSLLLDLTSKQDLLIKKYILAIYLILFEEYDKLVDIQNLTGLGHHHIDQIRLHFNIHPLKKRNPYKKLGLIMNGILSEMCGIILGDGNLNFNIGLTITLNRIDESDYVDYVSKLMTKIFHKTPSYIPSKVSKGIQLIIYGKEIVEELESFGLIEGNKVLHQVSVPKIIINSRNLVICCLRGLFDTDGSIYVLKRAKHIQIDFTNSSKPLVEDFKNMCNILNIETTKIYEDKRTDVKYYVKISKKNHIRKFIEIIKPKKWIYRRNYIGIILISLSNEIKSKKVFADVNDYMIKNDKKVLLYSKEFEQFILKTCLKYGYLINDSTIENAIQDSLTFKQFPYQEKFAIIFKKLFTILGNLELIRNYIKLKYGINPKPETIKKHIKIYMISQKLDFDLWYKNIKKFNQIIVKNKNGNWVISIFPADLREIIYNRILKILKDNNFYFDNDQILKDLVSVDIPEFLRLRISLQDQNFTYPIIQYLKMLIHIIQYISEPLNRNETPSPTKISKKILSIYININISKDQLRKLIYQAINLLN